MPRTNATATPSISKRTQTSPTDTITYTHLVLARHTLKPRYTRCDMCWSSMHGGQEVTALTRVGVTTTRHLTRRDVLGLVCDQCMKNVKDEADGNLQRELRFRVRVVVNMMRADADRLERVTRYPLIEEKSHDVELGRVASR